MLEVLEQVAGEPELRRRDRVAARELEGERGLPVVEHEPVVLGELARPACRRAGSRSPRPRRPAARARARRRRAGCRGARRPRGRTRRRARASSRRGRRGSRAERARRGLRARRAASRSCTSSARSTRASCSFASCAAIAFVSAMNGTSYGTVTSGKSSCSASSASASGGSAQPKPTPNASPASPCPARRRTYSRCGRESSPTPSPVVISSSPPSSHGVGSDSSETWTQRITFAAPPAPAASSSPRPGSAAISRTVSTVLCGVAWTRRAKTLLLARVGSKHLRRTARATSASLRHRVEARSGALASPSIALGAPRRERIAAVSLREHTVDDVLEARARYVARGVSTPKLVVTRADGAQVEAADGTRLPRLRRRDRLPEHRPRLRAGRRRDPRAGRPLPAPVLHGRHLRAVRRGLPPARRALSVQRLRAEVDPRQLGRRGDRERGQDRARRHRPARPLSFSTTASTAARS